MLQRAVPRRTHVKSPTPQEPSTSLPPYDKKYLLKKERGVFKLHDIDLEVPRGQPCAIVGPVGAGKSSLVQGMIGGMALRPRAAKITHRVAAEMRKAGGEVVFGGSVAYCAQTAWIQVRVVLRVPNVGDLRGSHRVLLFVTTSCLVPRTMENNISLWFVTIACFRISRSSREFAVLLLRFQCMPTTRQGMEI